MMASPRRPSPDHVPSALLSDLAHTKLYSLLGPRCRVLATAVVDVVVEKEGTMVSCSGHIHTGVTATLTKDAMRKNYLLQVYSLVKWHLLQEFVLPRGSTYRALSSHLHELCTQGQTVRLEFGFEEDAARFFEAAQRACRGPVSEGFSKPVAPPPPLARIASAAGSGTGDKRDENTIFEKRKKGMNEEEDDDQKTTIKKTVSAPTISPAVKASTPSPGPSPVKKRIDTRKITKGMIGLPQDFRHVYHVGFNPGAQDDGELLEVLQSKGDTPRRPAPPPPPVARPRKPGQSSTPPQHFISHSTPTLASTSPSTPIQHSTSPSTPIQPSTSPSTPIQHSTSPSTPIQPSTSPSTPIQHSTSPSTAPSPSTQVLAEQGVKCSSDDAVINMISFESDGSDGFDSSEVNADGSGDCDLSTSSGILTGAGVVDELLMLGAEMEGESDDADTSSEVDVGEEITPTASKNNDSRRVVGDPLRPTVDDVSPNDGRSVAAAGDSGIAESSVESFSSHQPPDLLLDLSPNEKSSTTPTRPEGDNGRNERDQHRNETQQQAAATESATLFNATPPPQSYPDTPPTTTAKPPPQPHPATPPTTPATPPPQPHPATPPTTPVAHHNSTTTPAQVATTSNVLTSGQRWPTVDTLEPPMNADLLKAPTPPPPHKRTVRRVGSNRPQEQPPPPPSPRT